MNNSDILPTVGRKTQLSIALVGAGNLAQAMGQTLRKAGFRIDAVAARDNALSRRRATALARKLGARVVILGDFAPASGIIWLCHTDDALPITARQLASNPGWKGKVVLHSSGALSSDVLQPLKRAGAYTASLHPMMTFVPGTAPNMKHVPFAVEGDRDFALGCMARGYASLCIEQRSFGERREQAQAQVSTHGCHDAAMQALLVGKTLAGERAAGVLS